MTSPKVSIIMPTYNRSQLIVRAIESVVNQTYENWKLIIIDDGSIEDTFLAIKDYFESYHMYYKRTEHTGPVGCLNEGLNHVEGDYVTILCDDDAYAPEHIELRIKFFERHPSVDFVHGGVKIIGEKFVKDKDDPSKLIHIDDCNVGGTFFGKRKVYDAVDGFRDVGYGGDADFIERVSKSFKVQRVFDRTYIYHRDHPDSLTHQV